MIQPKRLFDSTQLTNAAATYYTATNLRAVVTSLVAINTTGTARTVTVYLIKSGGTASASNTLIYQRTILPGETRELIDRNKNMEPSDFIQALADSGATVTFMGFGIEAPQNG